MLSQLSKMPALNPPFFLDQNHPANQEILKILQEDLGEAGDSLIQLFDECFRGSLQVRTNAKSSVGRYPIFVECHSGVIIGAVLGKYALALRYADAASAFRNRAIAQGAKTTFEFGGNSINLGEEWVFSVGNLDLKEFRTALSMTIDAYEKPIKARQREKELQDAIARSADSPINASHASNIAITEFFQKLHPKGIPSLAPPNSGPSGMHPDISDYFWQTLPQKSGFKDQAKQWMVYGVPVLVNASTGIIFAYVTATPSLGMRLPEKGRAEFAERKLINQQPEIGTDWVVNDLFRNEVDIVRWMGWAFEYAGQA